MGSKIIIETLRNWLEELIVIRKAWKMNRKIEETEK